MLRAIANFAPMKKKPMKPACKTGAVPEQFTEAKNIQALPGNPLEKDPLRRLIFMFSLLGPRKPQADLAVSLANLIGSARPACGLIER